MIWLVSLVTVVLLTLSTSSTKGVVTKPTTTTTTFSKKIEFFHRLQSRSHHPPPPKSPSIKAKTISITSKMKKMNHTVKAASHRGSSVEKNLPLFKQFYLLHNNLEVPNKFIVPYNDCKWPEQYWGNKLGSKVQHIRQSGREFYIASNRTDLVQVLDAMQFRWEIPTIHQIFRIDEKVEMLQCFYQHYGHLDVPQSFVIPANGSVWPAKYANVELGRIANIMIKNRTRNKSLFPKEWKELEDLGFDRNSKKCLKITEFLPLFDRFHAIYNHRNVQTSFVIPHNDTCWPSKYWGVKLGIAVRSIRSNGRDYYLTRDAVTLKALEASGFQWFTPRGKARKSPKKAENANRISRFEERWIPVVHKYYELHHHLNPPHNYKTPVDNASWPVKLQNKPFGLLVQRIRRKGPERCRRKDPRLYEALTQCGFRWNLNLSFPKKVKLLKKYHELHGNVEVRSNYIIPHADNIWPAQYHGYPLGEMVQKLAKTPTTLLRERFSKECYKELEALGWSWKKYRIRGKAFSLETE